MPKPRKSRPRNERFELFSRFTIAKLDLAHKTFMLKWAPMEDTPDEPAVLYLPTGVFKGMDLTALTTGELEHWKAFNDLAYETARPIVERLDKRAAEEHESGLGISRRLYRQASQLLNFNTPPPNPTIEDKDPDHAHDDEHRELPGELDRQRRE